MTDYKQLCADLVAAWDDLPWHYDWKGNLIGLADGCQLDDSAVERARAALAQPEPQGPTDEELQELASGFFTPTEFHFVDFARAALARWGRTAIEPVPVAERLPGPEDCDAEGRCFVWDWLATEWRFLERNVFEYGWEDAYWLPHHALPVPQQEVNDD